jgi:peptidoglycan/LPS O-acetylase OafA/YrhL
LLNFRPERRLNFIGAFPYDLFYLQEIPFIAGIRGEYEHTPFDHSWSLGIEEKFYLIWPFLAFVLFRSKDALRVVLALILVAVFATSPLWGGPTIGGCIFPYIHILLGCILAIMLHSGGGYHRLRHFGAPPMVVATTAIFLTIHFCWPRYANWPYIDGIDVVYSIAATSFLLSVLVNQGRLGKILSYGPLPFIGRLSYGIYLVHVLCLNAVDAAVNRLSTGGPGISWSVLRLFGSVALSIGVAYVLYATFEQPLIGMGRRWSMRIGERKAKLRNGEPVPMR